MQSTIKVKSKEGIGTTFTIKLKNFKEQVYTSNGEELNANLLNNVI